MPSMSQRGSVEWRLRVETGAMLPGLNSQLHNLLAVCDCLSYLASLSLGVSICKMGTKRVFPHTVIVKLNDSMHVKLRIVLDTQLALLAVRPRAARTSDETEQGNGLIGSAS